MDKKLALTILFNGADKLSPTLKKIVGLGENGGRAIGRMKGKVRELDKELEKLRAQRALDGQNTKLIRDEFELTQKLKLANAQLERQNKLIAINNRVGKMHAKAESYKSAGMSNMFGGAMMAAPLVLAGKAAMQYDKQLALIAQKTDMNAGQTRLFGRALLDAAQKAKQLPETMIEGADFLAGKGLNTNVVTKMMPQLGQFATAWDVNIVDSAKAGYAAFSSLKVPVDQTSRALEMMAAAGKAGGFEVKDMAQFFPLLTGQLATLGSTGLSAVADLSSALQVIEAQTGDGEQAATNLRNLFSFATSQRGINRFKQYGVDIVAVLKKAEKEGRSPIEALIGATEKATGGDMMKIAQVVSNQDAAKAITALIQRRDQYLKIRKQSIESAGLTEQEFKRMSKTSAAQWMTLKGSVETLAITLGSNLLPLVNKAVPVITSVANAVGNWARANPKTAETLLAVAAGLISARIGLGALQLGFGGILGPAATAWGLVMKFRALGGIVGIIEAVSAALPAMGAGFALLTGPIGLAVLAVAGVSYAVYRYWGPISAFFKKHWTLIRNIFLGAMVIFTPVIAAVVYLGSVIYHHWDQIKAATVSMVNKVAGIVGPFIAPFIKIETFLASLELKFVQFGANLIWGLIKGIASMGGQLVSSILHLVAKVGGTFAAQLGIKSPSRVFMQYGGYLTEGLALGIDQGHRRPVAAVGRLATGVASAMALSAAPATASGQRAAGGTGVNAQAPAVVNHITIHQQPGEDAQALAKRVADEIERRQQVARRGAYFDD